MKLSTLHAVACFILCHWLYSYVALPVFVTCLLQLLRTNYVNWYVQAYFSMVMARGGLSLVRDGLVTATVCDVIDEDEFVLLCDVYSPRSGNSTNNFDINTLSEDECHTKLWFFRKDRDKLHECLGIPEKSTLFKRKTVSSGLDCILLKPLCNPCRYTDIVPWFGGNPKELCLIFNAIVRLIYVNHNCRLWSCNQFFF